MMVCWYAVYTSSRAEKKVKERLEQAGVDCYLPLRTEFRIWSSRRKKVSVPLIPGYIFVHVRAEQFIEVLNIAGVVSFLKEKGKVVPIPDRQIKQLRFVECNAEEPVEMYFKEIPVGSLIKVVRGKFAGFEGELIEVSGKYKIVIRLEHLGCALMTISASCVEKVKV